LPRSAGCSQSAWISATQTAILRRESSVSNDPESYEPWPLPARESFEASTMPDWLRDAYMLALWTGQRESDVLRLSRSRFDGNGFVVRQGRPEAKRGKGRRGPVVTLYVPAAAPLRAYPARRIFTGLLFVSDAKGKPVRADELRKTMRAHLDSLGLYNLHFHGLRHSTATALAEAGCTALEIMAITGHQTEQMVKLYTKRVEQKKLATSAVRKLEKSGGGET
jgi:integrase